MTPEQQARIEERCTRCRYAVITQGLELRCVHHLCPGHIGGWGTEWAEHCTRFEEGQALIERPKYDLLSKEERQEFLKRRSKR